MIFFCQICIIKAIPQFLELNVFIIKTIPVDLLLSLKQLTFKTLALIAITSDREQALQSVNIKEMHIADACISFIITNKLKITKRVLKLKLVKCVGNSSTTKPWMLKVNNVEKMLKVM